MRTASRLLAMAGLLLACVVLFLLWRLFSRHNPWPRRFLGGIARISGAKVRLAGTGQVGSATAQKGSGQQVILLANHVSWLDVPILAGASGTAFVAHSGLMKSRFLAWLCSMNDTVFVARHDRRSVRAQVEQVRVALRDMGALTIFPEGTTSDGIGLLPFKSSLLSALDPPPPGIVVQPVWLDYGPQCANIAWVGDEPGLRNVMRILARRGALQVVVHLLQPFEPAEAGGRKQIAALAQARIAKAMAER